MKKYLITLCLTLVGTLWVCAQQTNTFSIDKFSKITVANGIKVILEKSDQYRVDVEGPEREDVEVRSDKGELKIRLKTAKSLKSRDVKVWVYYIDPIEEMNINSDAEINSSEPLKQDRLEINCSTAGLAFLKIDAKEIIASLGTGGCIMLTGSTISQKIKIASGGEYNCYDFLCDDTEVSVAMGGFANVRAAKSLKATVTMGGSVNYIGSPQQIEQKTTMGGSINKVKE